MGNMKPIDSAQVKEAMYDVLSPDTLGGEYMEVIGATCQNPNGYTSGSLFLAKDNGVQHLYKATAAIAFGATITLGTNCTYTNVSGELGGFSSQIQTLSQDVSSQNEALTNEVVTRAISGAHNFAPITNTSQVINGVTFTVSDTVKISGTVSTGQYVSFRLTEKHPIDVSLKGKECKLHYDNSKGGILYMWIEGYDSSNTKVLDKTILYNALDTTFTIPSSTETITMAITVLNSYDGALFDVQPMLILASDPSPSVYTPYAKSNRELTEHLGHSYVGPTPTTGTGNIYVDKVGDIVFVNIQVNFTPGTANAYTKIGQLADGYKPKRGFYAVVVDDNPTPTEFDYVGVSIDGEIKVWCDSTTLRKTRGMISFPVI